MNFSDSEIASEEWRTLPGFWGYEVSNLGRVSSRRKCGAGSNFLSNKRKLLKPRRDDSGYFHLHIVDKNGKRKFKAVHQLVLEAFIGPQPANSVCRHFPDRDPSNNRLSNLIYGTHKENYDDSIKHGTNSTGAKHGQSILTEGKVVVISMMNGLKNNERPGQREIAKAFGVKQSAIGDILRGVTWRHVTGLFKERPLRHYDRVK